MGEAVTRHSLRPLFSEGLACSRTRAHSAARTVKFAWKCSSHPPLSYPASSGASSIPETAVLESMGRGVLDRPVKPGDDLGVVGCLKSNQRMEAVIPRSGAAYAAFL